MEIQNTPAYANVGGGYTGSFDYLSWLTANQISELRRDVGETESRLKETAHSQSISMGKDFCDTNRNIDDAECNINKNLSDISNRNTIHLNSIERDLQNRIHENRQIIIERLDYETDIVKTQMKDFEVKVGERFCKVEGEIKDSKQCILNQLAADKLDEKNDIIARLRSKNERHEDRFIIANELSGLKSMINSIEQNQRFSSKTVQFGTGNLAGTAQTANQG